MTNKRNLPKDDKREIREENVLTRPPRLEGVVKNAMMKARRKEKRVRSSVSAQRKMQGISNRSRKEYQLKGPKH